MTTIVLLVLGQLVATVRARASLSVRKALAWGTLLAVGGACFGTGLGIAAGFPLVALLAFPPDRRSPRAIAVLGAAAIVILTVYVALRLGSPPPADPREQALLSSGALLAALPAAAALTLNLIAFGAYTLPLGFLGLDPGHPVTSAVGGVLVAGLGIAGWRTADGTTRRLLVALALLVVVAYGTVAFGRSTAIEFLKVSPAHAAAWPRYHYLALALLTAVGCTALGAVRTRGRMVRTVDGLAVAWAAARLVVLAVRPPALDLHLAVRAETLRALVAIRGAIAATPAGGVATIANQQFGSAAVPWLFPGWAGLFVIYFPDDVVDGRTVRFRVNEADWKLAQSRGGRLAALVERADHST